MAGIFTLESSLNFTYIPFFLTAAFFFSPPWTAGVLVARLIIPYSFLLAVSTQQVIK